MLVLAAFAAVDPITSLAIYGPLGLFTAAFMTGLVYSKHVVDRLVAERIKAEDRADAMLNDYKAVVPLLERAVDAIRSADAKSAASDVLNEQLRVALANNTAALQRISGYLDRR